MLKNHFLSADGNSTFHQVKQKTKFRYVICPYDYIFIDVCHQYTMFEASASNVEVGNCLPVELSMVTRRYP